MSVRESGQGVRFRVRDAERFASLRRLCREIKADKAQERFREDREWTRLVPDSVGHNFDWPSEKAREAWRKRRESTPVHVAPPAAHLGGRWDFFRVIECFEDGEYLLESCEMTGPDAAEIVIEPWAYPYGGVGCIIALVEAFGFEVLGVNEWGEYLTREQLLRDRDG